MLHVVDRRQQHSKTGLVFENALIFTPPSEEPYLLSAEGFENMLWSPADTCNLHGTTALVGPPIHPSQHQMKQYLDMENESAGFDMMHHAEQPPKDHNHSYWLASPSLFKSGRKSPRCYDLQSQSTVHSLESGSVLLPDRTREYGYGYGPTPSTAPSEVHGRIEGSSITSYSETDSETASSGFSLSPNVHEHEHEHERDPPCVLTQQACNWAAAGDLPDGFMMLQDSPSVGTATDSFESPCGAVTPLSWSAFNTSHPSIDMGQEDPGYGNAHALWPSAQQFPDEPTPFIPVPTSHYDPAPRIPESPSLPDQYQYQTQRYHHQEQQPLPNTTYRPDPPLNIPISLSKDQATTGHIQSQIQFNINPSPNSYHAGHFYGTSTSTSTTDECALNRPPAKSIPCQIDTRNALLIEYKRRGLSYKDIKRIGGFREAESTLRGRFRTLTKTKDQRVRKPLWSEKDVCSSLSPFFPIFFLSLVTFQTLSFKAQPNPKY